MQEIGYKLCSYKSHYSQLVTTYYLVKTRIKRERERIIVSGAQILWSRASYKYREREGSMA